MTAAFLRQICLLVLLIVLTAPAAALAASPTMRNASISLTEKSVVAAAKGDASRARRLLEEAVVADPANARALSLLGHLYRSSENAALARKYYALALSIDPAEPDALLGEGELSIADGKLDDAKDKLGRLRATCPACLQTRELERALEEAKRLPSPGQSSNQPTHP